MAPRKGENTKKAAGNAKKAEAAAQKQAELDAKAADEDDEKWSKGAKSNAKKEAVAAKAAAQAAAKAERKALLEAEEANQRSTPKGAKAKTSQKKSKGTLDLELLDSEPSDLKQPTLNASGIDSALDALSLTGSPDSQKIERHPERRYKAAYKAYEERRMPELEVEHSGLRKQQRVELIKKEFEKSPENPFNQANIVGYDARKDDIANVKEKWREGIEERLAEKS